MLLRAFGNLFMVSGVALLLGFGAFTVYTSIEGGLEQERLAREAAIRQAMAPQEASSSAVAAGEPAPPAPAPRRALTPEHLAIPAIGVDTQVVPSPIVQGEWKVPRFVAGHLEGTARPGQGSNVALAGHLQSLRNGNVFADLDKLQPGDEVLLSAEGEELRYLVRESRLVPPSEVSVVAPTLEERLTLITCAGSWDWLRGGYSHRLIVVATPVGRAELR